VGGWGGVREEVGLWVEHLMLYTPINLQGLVLQGTQHSSGVKMGLVLCGYLLP